MHGIVSVSGVIHFNRFVSVGNSEFSHEQQMYSVKKKHLEFFFVSVVLRHLKSNHPSHHSTISQAAG